MKARVAFCFITACVLVCGILSNPLQAGITVTDLNSSYNQDFNSLVSAGTNQAWSNNTTLQGWSLFTGAGTAIESYNAGTGSSTAGSFYSFGLAADDRALGGLGSGGTYFGSPATGAVAGYIAVQFINGSGSTLDSFSLSFTGEQWRNGGNATAQTMVFQYGFGTAFSDVGSNWITPGGSFNFTSPVTGTTAAAVDGNVAGRVPNLGGAVTGLNWNDGQSLWLRWVEANDAGNDHGLAIDDFRFSVTAVPEPSSMLLLGCVGVVGGAWRLRKRICPR